MRFVNSFLCIRNVVNLLMINRYINGHLIMLIMEYSTLQAGGMNRGFVVLVVVTIEVLFSGGACGFIALSGICRVSNCIQEGDFIDQWIWNTTHQ